jgi:hypothetical protein
MYLLGLMITTFRDDRLQFDMSGKNSFSAES